MAGDLGAIIGPIVAGQLADLASYRAAFLATAALLALATVVGASAPEPRR
jgi:MFS family permease